MRPAAFAGLTVGVLSGVGWGATPVATYEFADSFAADQPGVPALSVVDPLGTSGFVSDTVFGEARRVWAFNGDVSPLNQAGLTLNTSGLVNPRSYSVDLIFELGTRVNQWRRILDVQNRQSDNGFYVDPSNNLNIYPVSGSTAAWTNGVYHHVVLTNSGTVVNAYLDGVSQFTANTTEMNLDYDPVNNPDRLLGFFIDNVIAGGQQEYATGRIALARLWNGVLTPAEGQALAGASPHILAWRSVRTHGGSGDLSIALNTSASGNGPTGPTVEPRQGGLQKIQIDFDQPMTIVNLSAIGIVGRTTSGGILGPPVDYTPQMTVSMAGSQTLQLAFNQGVLPDRTCYFMTIGNGVQNVNGVPPLGATQSNIRTLVGDVTGDGLVNLSDGLAIKARVGAGASLSPDCDPDLSGGSITTADALVAKTRVASPAIQTLCP